MTQEEIVEMAREAGWSGIYSSWTSPTNRTSLTVPVTMQQIEAFAKLIAAKEREACAKFFDDNDTNIFWGSEAARFIRARGEQA